MKANRTAPPIVIRRLAAPRPAALGPAALSLALLAGCSSAPSPAPAPVPAPVEVTRPYTLPPAPVAPAADWRDAPITAGVWSWSLAGTRSVASFREPGGAVLVMISCESPGGEVRLARAGNAAVAVAMAVTTTTGPRPLLSAPAISPAGWVVAPLRARDPVLDEIAFSRGRFAFDVAGLPSLYLPSWPEISRVIEDCR